jgi:hypothetical protein
MFKNPTALDTFFGCVRAVGISLLIEHAKDTEQEHDGRDHGQDVQNPIIVIWPMGHRSGSSRLWLMALAVSNGFRMSSALAPSAVFSGFATATR